ncbi:MAG TPA: hypothetical protein VMF58_06935 [Rhizomicrobium sp.]|nr:hypothetical protein [Rhizomicrobium sp.]
MSEPSGVAWCARFPTSVSPDDLLPAFRDRVLAFISAMERGGAKVSIGATYRPPQRAYLMHWCCMIADSGQDPSAVPQMPAVDIDWSHSGDVADARMAAAAMKSAYEIRFPAALASRHTQRRAIDMTISWDGTLPIRDFNGQERSITMPPRSGSNQVLVDVGRSFGVIKLMTDPPHWSDDGH